MNRTVSIISFLFTIFSCSPVKPQSEHMHSNKLINENSPYLLQHAHNPVDWFPWGEEALKKAGKEDKMLIISIGYAACHWCHVMERESFEDTAVARVMNEYFISIKVDREERPDVDDVYMTACQIASSQGCGWPLNAFAFPDGRPVWAGTYYPKEQWLNVLSQFIKLWESDRTKLEDFATRLVQGIQHSDILNLAEASDLSLRDAHAMAKALIQQIDPKKGGRSGAPKFPMPNNYLYLLNYYRMTGEQDALEKVEITLDHMAKGGIYDQLGGGFARYSVDAEWKVPHFEKMLYDNGQLMNLYATAYQLTGKERYKEIVQEISVFVARELTDSTGGFYSSLDADSEGEEGKFYIWYRDEIDSLLTHEESEALCTYYSISMEGNWEHGKNILHRENEVSVILRELNLEKNELDELLTTAKQKLFEARETRVRPGLDDKILTSWNALMLKGYVSAFRALGNEEYLEIALKNGNFIRKEMMQSDHRLLRNYKDGVSKINGFLEDYAQVAIAFLDLYQVTYDEGWLKDARALTEYALDHFYDDQDGMFHFTSMLDAPLAARKKEIMDNVIPGSNSIMARNLNFLYHYFEDERYRTISDQMLYNLFETLVKSGQTGFYSNWALLFLEKVHPTFEIAILGPGAIEYTHDLQKQFLPNAVFMGGTTEGNIPLLEDKLREGETTIYVCQNRVCQLPVNAVVRALEQLSYL